jgi:hypothetical protein
MAGPIYKLYMGKPTEAWYQLSEEEKADFLAKTGPEKVGGKTLIYCNPVWASEEWMYFGVEEYPDIEAVQRHAQELTEMDWYRYIDSMSVLGTKWSE